MFVYKEYQLDHDDYFILTGTTVVSRQYEPRTDFWSQSYNKSMMPKGRDRHCMVDHRGKIYVLGGEYCGQ